MKIGIIGFGYVGTAVYESFKDVVDTKIFDLYKKDISVDSLQELTDERILFLCLPTPMKKTGECDISIVDSTLKQLNNFQSQQKIRTIIKSTIPPGTTEKFIKKYKNLNITFSPEFLTEANFIEDFKNQNRIIIGTIDSKNFEIIKSLFRIVFPKIKIIHISPTSAEMVKYTANVFLATKVSFANEINMICKKLNVEYDEVVNIARLDHRLGDSHWQVPGPDGKLGFGGSCFPKDINALIYFCKINDIPIKTIVSAWKTNLEVRPKKDWEELKGRAVSNSEF